MSVETLEQKIAKQEERLKQLKAQKQAVIAVKKRNNLNRNEKMKLDVKFYSVLT
jgi:membrane protein involved in colicin uptake